MFPISVHFSSAPILMFLMNSPVDARTEQRGAGFDVGALSGFFNRRADILSSLLWSDLALSAQLSQKLFCTHYEAVSLKTRKAKA